MLQPLRFGLSSAFTVTWHVAFFDLMATGVRCRSAAARRAEVLATRRHGDNNSAPLKSAERILNGDQINIRREAAELLPRGWPRLSPKF